MAKLFGFSIEETQKKSTSIISPVPKNNEDGVDNFISSGFYGQYVDIEGAYRSEYDLIKRYREMALHPEVDGAIEDVVNEAIVSDLYDSPVEVELSNLNATESIKKKIREEFRYIKELMDFDKKSHEIFRNWYVDGRVFYLKVIDVKAPQEGLQDLRYIDPLKMKFIRQEKKKPGNGDLSVRLRNNEDAVPNPEFDEYYLYTPKIQHPTSMIGQMGDKKAVKIAKDSVCYCTSGLVDRNKNRVLSYLHKAIKGLNQLRMIEDSLVIYRLSRAPERRIFYIDVGNLPKNKAEQYLREVMGRYRNKLVYDANTGEIKDDKKFMSMLEDFWLPRREGGRGTEITTLPGGQNLGELEDVKYFQKKLYKSLNVPNSRLETETTFNIGRAAEITRDEVKFQKFVARLRKRFSELFTDLLKTQLILKGILTLEDWESMKEHVQFDYIADNYFTELKEIEIRNERMNEVANMDPYVGKYFSADYIRRQVLKHTDVEIKEIDKQIKQEISDGIIMDPMAMQAIEMGIGEDPMTDDAALSGGTNGGSTADPKSSISSGDQKRAEF